MKSVVAPTNSEPPHTSSDVTPTGNEPPYNLTRFIVLETSVAFFTAIVLYLLAALLCFEWKKSRLASLQPHARTERSAHFSLAMRVASISALFFTLGRLVCEHYELLAQYEGVQHDYCNTIIKVKITLSGIAVLGVYLFLWTRQRFCYSDPAMQHLSSRTTRYLSWSSLALLILAQSVGSVLFLATRFYELTYRGCFNSYNTIPPELPWIWVGVATVSSQVLLLFLFINPLIRHKALIGSDTPTRSFLPVIKRASVTSSVCVITDLISSLLILLVKDADEIIPTLAYDVSLITNVICVVFCFSDWRSRLFAPFYCPRPNHKRSTPGGDPSFYGKIKSIKVNGDVAPQPPFPSSLPMPQMMTSTSETERRSVCTISSGASSPDHSGSVVGVARIQTIQEATVT